VSYQNLQGMNSYNIAVSMANGYTPFGDQAMRDLQQYDPQKYQEIQDELKRIQVGEQINQISTGGKIDIT
jgi:spore maturation protein SpmA